MQSSVPEEGWRTGLKGRLWPYCEWPQRTTEDVWTLPYCHGALQKVLDKGNSAEDRFR